MKTLLAHSAKGGIPSQTYREHILEVNRLAQENIKNAVQFFKGGYHEQNQLLKAVDDGSLFHDLGKLDELNQSILHIPDSKKKLPINHCDAGVAYLWNKKAWSGALLTYCHHRGLFSLSEEIKKEDSAKAFRDLNIDDHTIERLSCYTKMHFAEMGYEEPTPDDTRLKGLSLRFALSCLVDADHHDTARHYKQESSVEAPSRSWGKRLDSLDHYVKKLGGSEQNFRNDLRDRIYDVCRNGYLAQTPSITCCDAPVGSGKTTAVMAHLLRVAEHNKLRHIFVVLPYTNIIKQSVDTYRKALVLPGENPEDIVAAHYHQAEFSDLHSRHLTTLWRSPIIVTSAVQFFETISAASTSKLRKLHELPGSAVFIDESHSAMPMHIWPQQWVWINELANQWSTHFTFASGSLVKFWELKEFSEKCSKVSNIIPEKLHEKSVTFERERVVYPKRPNPMNRQELSSFILDKSGPRLVILNTVQSAAVVANELKQSGHETLHLSTALAPVDRETIIRRIQRKLEFEAQPNWTLVATSCVEAGIDFSFKTALRESSTLTSLIQTGGRVNRHGKYSRSQVIDFRVRDPLLNKHPAFDDSRTVLDDIFEENLFASHTPTELASISVERELQKNMVIAKSEKIMTAESGQEYKDVAKLCRIIDADTKLVVVTPSVVKKLHQHDDVSFNELLQNSVQLWSDKITNLGLEQISNHEELYRFGQHSYDPDFLGYMAGLLPIIYKDQIGLII